MGQEIETQEASPALNMTETKYCSGCGKLIHKTAVQCPHCGAPQADVRKNQRSRTAACLWALFLGGIGAHKFYLGRPGLGVLYLAFCWTFIPAFIALIEFLLFLGMSDEKFHAKYG